MIALYVTVALAYFVSLCFSREKTVKALVSGGRKLWKITPPFISVLLGISVVLYLVPHQMISERLGGSGNISGLLTASLIGSITFMPGPVVFPLCRILANEGVAYSVNAAFSTTLMMVGILTFPMEKSFFGWKFALLRNLISYFTALLIALVFSLIQGVLI